jgi:hypothetical protein
MILKFLSVFFTLLPVTKKEKKINYKSVKFLLFSLLFVLVSTSCKISNNNNKNKKTTNNQNNEQQPQKSDTQDQQKINDLYISYETYKKNNAEKILKINQSLNNIDSKQTTNSTLKIGVIMPNDNNELSNEIKSTISLYLWQTSNKNVSIIPIKTDFDPVSVKKALSLIDFKSLNIIISTLPTALANIACLEISLASKNAIFISLANIPKNDNCQNTISFGFNPIDQIYSMAYFAKHNSIKSFSTILPNNKFGGDLILMINNVFSTLGSESINNAEFFTNSTTLSRVDITQTKNENTNRLQNQDKTLIEKHDENADEYKDDSSKIKTDIAFYLNKVLYYHSKKLHKINQFVQNFSSPESQQSNQKKEPIWKNPKDALKEKKLILFFTGSYEEKIEFLKILDFYKSKQRFEEVFKNLVVIMDSSFEDIVVANSKFPSENSKYYKDIFALSLNSSELPVYRSYFEQQMGFVPSKLSSLLYDSLSFVNYTNSKFEKNKDTDFKQMLFNTNQFSSSNLSGINGEFVIENGIVKRKYSFIYIDGKSNILQI